MSKRTHVQFSGSLQPDDAAEVVSLLKQAIERRPENCGSFLFVRDIESDTAEENSPRVSISVDEFIEGLK